jgi:hypothetical protein
VFIYLTTDDVLTIKVRFAGPDQLRDFGLVDAAVIRPQTSAFGEDAFPTIHEKAAALLHGLALRSRSSVIFRCPSGRSPYDAPRDSLGLEAIAEVSTQNRCCGASLSGYRPSPH